MDSEERRNLLDSYARRLENRRVSKHAQWSFIDTDIADLVAAGLDLCEEVARLTAERDKAREECGHERHMRGFNSEERDKWVRKFIEGEAERDQLRGEVERLQAAITDIDSHATPMAEDEQGFVTGGYRVTVGALHRALAANEGRTGVPCDCDQLRASLEAARRTIESAIGHWEVGGQEQAISDLWTWKNTYDAILSTDNQGAAEPLPGEPLEGSPGGYREPLGPIRFIAPSTAQRPEAPPEDGASETFTRPEGVR